MQIGIATSLPAHQVHLFQARRAGSFKYNQSPLNPSVISSSSSTADCTKRHLSNLDKLLQKDEPPTSRYNRLDSIPKVPRPDGGASAAGWANRGRNLLEELNLARIWPELKAAEEMSPRHLNRLQRLLSKTPEYSPRNSLASRWRDYHDGDDWKGMLEGRKGSEGKGDRWGKEGVRGKRRGSPAVGGEWRL